MSDCLTCEEVEFQLRGGWDPDGPIRGLDGLDLPGIANVLHSRAVRAEMLEAATRAHMHGIAADTAEERLERNRRLWDALEDD